MNILFCGDPHLKISNLSAAKQFLNWLSSVVEETQPDIFINLGDTFDTHSVVRAELLNEFKKHILEITKHCQYFYILGNHDMHKPNDSTYHALQAFSGQYERFTVIDSISHIENLGLSMVPYLPDHTLFPKKTLPICVAHQTFIGCDFGGYKPESGVNADEIEAEIIISGHIHNKQSFGKVVYPGSPYAQSMKDIDQVKGLLLFNTKTYKQLVIETPMPSWRGLEVSLKDQIDPIPFIKGCINQTDNWVITLIGPRKEIAGLLESREWKNISNDNNISTRTKYIDSDRINKIKIKSNTISGILDEYIDKIYSGNLDKDTIKIVAKQLFESTNKSI